MVPQRRSRRAGTALAAHFHAGKVGLCTGANTRTGTVIVGSTTNAEIFVSRALFGVNAPGVVKDEGTRALTAGHALESADWFEHVAGSHAVGAARVPDFAVRARWCGVFPGKWVHWWCQDGEDVVGDVLRWRWWY